eukprot:m51a1_g10319 hypothetical protein (572) ;mRNA; r:39695-41983
MTSGPSCRCTAALLCAVVALSLWAAVVAVRWDLVDSTAALSAPNMTFYFLNTMMPSDRVLVEVFDPLGAPVRAPFLVSYQRMIWDLDFGWYFDTPDFDLPRGINATNALLPSGAGGAVVLALTDPWNNVPVATLVLNTSRILEGLARVLASDHGSKAVLQGLGIAHGQARQSQSPAPVLAADALWTCVRWLLLPAPVLAVLGLCALHPAVSVVPPNDARAARSAPQHKWSLSRFAHARGLFFPRFVACLWVSAVVAGIRASCTIDLVFAAVLFLPRRVTGAVIAVVAIVIAVTVITTETSPRDILSGLATMFFVGIAIILLVVAGVWQCLPSAFIAWAARALFTAFVIFNACFISPIVGPWGSVALLWGFVALLPWAVGRRSRWLQSAASLLLFLGVLSTPLGGLVGKELSMPDIHHEYDVSVQAAVASLVLVAVHRVLLWAAGPEGIDVDPVTEGLGYSGALLTGLYISSCWHSWHTELWLLAQLYMMALLAAAALMGNPQGAGRLMRSRIVAAATVYSVVKCIEVFVFGGIGLGVAVAWFLVLGLCIRWDRRQQKSIEQPSKEHQQHVE